MMPLSKQIYTFPDLPQVSFHGLPGMLADALPDKFGNAVIDAWLAAGGRLPQDIDAVERLCYTGVARDGSVGIQARPRAAEQEVHGSQGRRPGRACC